MYAYVCMYVCMYGWMYICIYAHCMYVCMYICMDVYMYLCTLYVCMYVCMYIYTAECCMGLKDAIGSEPAKLESVLIHQGHHVGMLE